MHDLLPVHMAVQHRIIKEGLKAWPELGTCKIWGRGKLGSQSAGNYGAGKKRGVMCKVWGAR